MPVLDQVRHAAAAITVAEAALVSAQAQVAEKRASLERDQAQYERWKSELERMTELAGKGAVTRKLVDETENQYRAADSSRKETAAKIRSAEAVLGESSAFVEKAQADRDAATAKLKVSQADEQRVQALWGYATIRAPFDGIVSVRNLDRGHLVQAGGSSAGKPLFVVVRTDVVRIFVDVPETDAVLTQRRNEARVSVPSLSSETFEGTITRTSYVLEAGTRTLRAEIDIENSDGKLRPGMYAHADVKVAEHKDALSLPKSAVLRQENQAFCYTLNANGKVSKTPVVTGIQSGNDTEILSGLKGDESVIGTNAASFREGQEVEIVEAEEKK